MRHTIGQLAHAKVGRPEAAPHQRGHSLLELPQRRLLVLKAPYPNVSKLQGPCHQHGIVAAPLPVLHTRSYFD